MVTCNSAPILPDFVNQTGLVSEAGMGHVQLSFGAHLCLYTCKCVLYHFGLQ